MSDSAKKNIDKINQTASEGLEQLNRIESMLKDLGQKAEDVSVASNNVKRTVDKAKKNQDSMKTSIDELSKSTGNIKKASKQIESAYAYAGESISKAQRSFNEKINNIKVGNSNKKIVFDPKIKFKVNTNGSTGEAFINEYGKYLDNIKIQIDELEKRKLSAEQDKKNIDFGDIVKTLENKKINISKYYTGTVEQNSELETTLKLLTYLRNMASRLSVEMKSYNLIQDPSIEILEKKVELNGNLLKIYNKIQGKEEYLSQIHPEIKFTKLLSDEKLTSMTNVLQKNYDKNLQAINDIFNPLLERTDELMKSYSNIISSLKSGNAYELLPSKMFQKKELSNLVSGDKFDSYFESKYGNHKLYRTSDEQKINEQKFELEILTDKLKYESIKSDNTRAQLIGYITNLASNENKNIEEFISSYDADVRKKINELFNEDKWSKLSSLIMKNNNIKIQDQTNYYHDIEDIVNNLNNTYIQNKQLSPISAFGFNSVEEGEKALAICDAMILKMKELYSLAEADGYKQNSLSEMFNSIQYAETQLKTAISTQLNNVMVSSQQKIVDEAIGYNIDNSKAETPKELIEYYSQIFNQINQGGYNAQEVIELLNNKAKELGVTFDDTSKKWIQIQSATAVNNDDFQHKLHIYTEANKDRNEGNITSFNGDDWNYSKQQLEYIANYIQDIQKKIFQTTDTKILDDLNKDLESAQISFIGLYDTINEFFNYRIDKPRQIKGFIRELYSSIASDDVKDEYNKIQKQSYAELMSGLNNSSTTTSQSTMDTKHIEEEAESIARDRIEKLKKDIEYYKNEVLKDDPEGIFSKVLLGEDGFLKTSDQVKSELDALLSDVDDKFGKWINNNPKASDDDIQKYLNRVASKLFQYTAIADSNTLYEGNFRDVYDGDLVTNAGRHLVEYKNYWNARSNPSASMKKIQSLSQDGMSELEQYYSYLKDRQIELNTLQVNGTRDYINVLEEALRINKELQTIKVENSNAGNVDGDKITLSENDVKSQIKLIVTTRDKIDELKASLSDLLVKTEPFKKGLMYSVDEKFINETTLNNLSDELDIINNKLFTDQKQYNTFLTDINQKEYDKFINIFPSSDVPDELGDKYYNFFTDIINGVIKADEAIKLFKEDLNKVGYFDTQSSTMIETKPIEEIVKEDENLNNVLSQTLRLKELINREQINGSEFKEIIDAIPPEKLNQINNMLNRTLELTSDIGVSVDVMTSSVGKYFELTGTRSKVNFFLNNEGEFTKKPNKNKVDFSRDTKYIKGLNAYDNYDLYDKALHLNTQQVVDSNHIKEVSKAQEQLSENTDKVNTELEQTQHKVVQCYEDIRDIILQIDEKDKGFYENVRGSGYVENSKELLQQLGIVDELGEKVIQLNESGLSKLGAIITDQFTILISKTGNETENLDMLIKKMEEAQEKGISLGKILGEFSTNRGVYQVQETVKGESFYSFGGKRLELIEEQNNALSIQDKHIQQLIKDIITMDSIGFKIDGTSRNLLYDKNQGFSFIDLDLKEANKEALNLRQIMMYVSNALTGGYADRGAIFDEENIHNTILLMSKVKQSFLDVGYTVREINETMMQLPEHVKNLEMLNEINKIIDKNDVIPVEIIDRFDKLQQKIIESHYALYNLENEFNKASGYKELWKTKLEANNDIKDADLFASFESKLKTDLIKKSSLYEQTYGMLPEVDTFDRDTLRKKVDDYNIKNRPLKVIQEEITAEQQKLDVLIQQSDVLKEQIITKQFNIDSSTLKTAQEQLEQKLEQQHKRRLKISNNEFLEKHKLIEEVEKQAKAEENVSEAVEQAETKKQNAITKTEKELENAKKKYEELINTTVDAGSDFETLLNNKIIEILQSTDNENASYKIRTDGNDKLQKADVTYTNKAIGQTVTETYVWHKANEQIEDDYNRLILDHKVLSQKTVDQQNEIEKANSFLSKQETLLKNINALYDKQVNPNTKKGINDKNDLNTLREMSKKLSQKIKDNIGKSIISSMKDSILSEMADLERTRKSLTDKEYGATELSPKELNINKSIIKNQYDEQIAKLKAAGEYTSELVKKMQEVRNSIDSIGKSEGIKNASDKLKEFTSEFGKLKSEQKLQQKQQEKQKQEESAKIEKVTTAYENLLNLTKQSISFTDGKHNIEFNRITEEIKVARIEYENLLNDFNSKNNIDLKLKLSDSISSIDQDYDNKFSQAGSKIEQGYMNQIVKFEERLKKSNLYTDEAKEKIEMLKLSLNNLSESYGNVQLQDYIKQLGVFGKNLPKTFNDILNIENISGIDKTLDQMLGFDNLTNKTSRFQSIVVGLKNALNDLQKNRNDKNGILNETELEQESKILDLILKRINEINKSKSYNKTTDQGTLVGENQIFGINDASAALDKLAQSYGNYKILSEKTLDAKDDDGLATEKLSKTYKYADGTVRTFNGTLQNAAQGLRYTEQATKGAHNILGTFGSVAKQVAGYMTMYFTGYRMISKFVSSLQEGINIVKEFDLAMTELIKVSNDTEEALYNFQSESFEIASTIGSTGKEIINSAAAWEKLGYAINDASELAKNSALYSNVGDMDIDTATEHMVSTLKAFNIEAENSIMIVDKFNEIGNNYAITSEGIGAALERSAASLVAAGNDINESIALITAGNVIAQNPETVGNAVKVVSMRLRGSKEQLEEMGEDTDGLIDSTSKLQNKIKALTGVDIMEDENTFKSTYEILLEISKVWDDLSDLSQANVLEVIAGKVRGSVVAGLLQQGETLESVFNNASEAEGSAVEENKKYLESVQGHLDKFNNAWQKLWTEALSRQVINFFIDIGTAALEVADNLGLIPSAIIAIGTALAGLTIFKELKYKMSMGGGRAKTIIKFIIIIIKFALI